MKNSPLFTCYNSNAEIGIGLICACLPPLNALIGQRRQQSSSRKNFSNSRDHELSRVNTTANGLKDTVSRTHEAESDKDYLITNAQFNGGFETSVRGESTVKDSGDGQPGIVKTVDVSHAYERR